MDLLGDIGRPVIGYDLPGHGARINAPKAAFASVGEDLLAELCLSAPVDVVGFSAGARIAANITAMRPDLIGKLVLIGASDVFLSAMDPAPLIAALLSEQPPAKATHATLHRLARAPGNSVVGLANFLRLSTFQVMPHMLAQVTSEVLLITGSKDANGRADRLLSFLPRARHVELDGCDHFRLPSDPRTIEGVLDFLTS